MSTRVNNDLRGRGLCDKPENIEIMFSPSDSDVEYVSERGSLPMHHVIVGPIHHQDKLLKWCRCCCCVAAIPLIPLLVIGFVILLLKMLVYPDFKIHLNPE